MPTIPRCIGWDRSFRLIAVGRAFDVVDHAIAGVVRSTRSEPDGRYGVLRDAAARGVPSAARV